MQVTTRLNGRTPGAPGTRCTRRLPRALSSTRSPTPDTSAWRHLRRNSGQAPNSARPHRAAIASRRPRNNKTPSSSPLSLSTSRPRTTHSWPSTPRRSTSRSGSSILRTQTPASPLGSQASRIRRGGCRGGTAQVSACTATTAGAS